MIGPSPAADGEQNLGIAGLSRRFAAICLGLTVPYLEVFTDPDWLVEIEADAMVEE